MAVPISGLSRTYRNIYGDLVTVNFFSTGEGQENIMAKHPEIPVTTGDQLKKENEAREAREAATKAEKSVEVAEKLENETVVEEAPVSNSTAIIGAGSREVEGFFASDEIEAMDGYGQENAQAKDMLLPRLTILQSLSPQIKKNKMEYIPGAEEGDFCDVAVSEFWKKEVDLIPCFFSTQYIQWKKNRGGFAGNLGMDIDILKQCTINEKRQYILPNGDEIVETAHWFCLVRSGADWRRVFFPMSKTSLKCSRKWMTLIRAETLVGRKGPFKPPLFYRPWTMTVATESNDQGDWLTPVPHRKKRDPADVTVNQPDTDYTIYHLMAEMGDKRRWLLEECKKFYTEARDQLVIGDLGGDDPNDPANARVAGEQRALDDESKSM